MPGYPKPNGLLDAVTGMQHDIRKNGTRSHQNPDDTPLAPTLVDLDFRVREKQNRIDYDGIASCSAVTPNTCAAEIQAYVFMVKAVKQNGDPIPENQLDSGEEIKWSKVVTRRDASDMTTPHAVFERIPNPKEWYFIVRARVIDRIGHLGLWSDWTSPVKPVQVADPIPPTPSGIAMSFDRVEKDRYHRYRCIATCNEINNWDIPGGDHEGDIDRYEFELRKSDDVGTPDTESGRRQIVHQKADNNNIAKTVFFPVRKNAYYVLRVRAIDRFNRRGDWSTWFGPGSVSDTTKPPAPVGVFAEGLFNSVAIAWDNPVDANNDPAEDVAYFQVHRATDRNFDNIVNKDLYVAGTRRTWPSRAYKQRFWLRVRSVDASGIKGDWIQAGPVSPQKATAGRQVAPATNTPTVSDIDWNSEGVDLAGQITNRAYNVSGTNGVNLHAWVEGEAAFGTIVSRIQFSPTANRTRVGVVFHYIDASNFMYVALEKTAANGSIIRLRKVVAGVDSSLSSTTAFTFQDGQMYTLKVVVSTTTVQYIVDTTTFAAIGISSGDQTTFNGATKVGLYKKRGASTDDDGGSRHETFSWSGDPAGTGAEVIVDDDFDRAPSTTSLGNAASGQGWTSSSGTWGIIDESVPTAIFGYGVILPILYMDDPNERNGINVKATGSGNITLMAQGGESTTASPNNPLTVSIDRPTRILMMAWANFMNESGTVDYNLHMFAVVQDDNDVLYLGRQTKAYGAISDSGGIGKRRLISTAHQVFLDPGASPMDIRFYWGYRQSDTSSRPATLANQKMIILLSYAPDYVPSTPNTRVPWSPSAKMAKAYRGAEPDDT